jgi:hypothetical protein
MSIATMMALSFERQQLQHPIPPEAAAASEAAVTNEKTDGAALEGDSVSKKTLDSAMEKITAFIPSEVIGSYVAVLGILSPQTDVGKWIIFGICLLLIPIFMLLGYLAKKKQAEKDQKTTLPPNTQHTGILLVLAAVAFVAWAMALPGTPFLSITAHATAIGGASVIILTTIMYKIADLFDLVPKS